MRSKNGDRISFRLWPRVLQLDGAIKAKDREKFVAAYEFTLTTCYSCHKAADKPYLRSRIPEHPASTMMNFNPNATWPK